MNVILSSLCRGGWVEAKEVGIVEDSWERWWRLEWWFMQWHGSSETHDVDLLEKWLRRWQKSGWKGGRVGWWFGSRNVDGRWCFDFLRESWWCILLGRDFRFGVGLKSLFVVGAVVGFSQTLWGSWWLRRCRFLSGDRNCVHFSGTRIGVKCWLERIVQIFLDSGRICRRRLDRWRRNCRCLSLMCCCSQSWC